jgi:hypothetical protein
MTVSQDTLDLIAEIFANTERPDKVTLVLDSNSMSLVVTYEDLDAEYFNELTQEANRNNAVANLL